MPWQLGLYLEPRKTSKMELFAILINGFKTFPVFAKISILDICRAEAYS